MQLLSCNLPFKLNFFMLFIGRGLHVLASCLVLTVVFMESNNDWWFYMSNWGSLVSSIYALSCLVWFSWQNESPWIQELIFNVAMTMQLNIVLLFHCFCLGGINHFFKDAFIQHELLFLILCLELCVTKRKSVQLHGPFFSFVIHLVYWIFNFVMETQFSKNIYPIMQNWKLTPWVYIAIIADLFLVMGLSQGINTLLHSEFYSRFLSKRNLQPSEDEPLIPNNNTMIQISI